MATESAKKRPKVAAIPSSIIVAFVNQDGDNSGPPIDLPVATTTKQLEQLVNSLLENENTVSQS